MKRVRSVGHFELAAEERFIADSQEGLVKDDLFDIDSFIACQRVVDEPEFPASFAIDQQHACHIVDDIDEQFFLVVVVPDLIGMRFDPYHQSLSAQLRGGPFEGHLVRVAGGNDGLDECFSGRVDGEHRDGDRPIAKSAGTNRCCQSQGVVAKHGSWRVEGGDREVAWQSVRSDRHAVDGNGLAGESFGGFERVVGFGMASIAEQDECDEWRVVCVGAGSEASSEASSEGCGEVGAVGVEGRWRWAGDGLVADGFCCSAKHAVLDFADLLERLDQPRVSVDEPVDDMLSRQFRDRIEHLVEIRSSDVFQLLLPFWVVGFAGIDPLWFALCLEIGSPAVESILDA